MTVERHHWLTRLYPRRWRERYGDELGELIEQEGYGLRTIIDIAKSAAAEQISCLSNIGAETVKTYPSNIAALARRPSAITPIAMSIGALATVLIAILAAGRRHEPDEGAAAHIFQLLIAGQLPFVAWFALHWLKQDFKASLTILAVQILAAAAALFPVWYFGL